MKFNLFTKSYFFLFLSVTFIFILYVSMKDVKSTENLLLNNEKNTKFQEKLREIQNEVVIENTSDVSEVAISSKSELKMKYMLLWTPPSNVPFVYMGVGQQGFIDRNCPYTNCFVTGDRNYLGHYTKFDLIAFCGPQIVNMHKSELPQRRKPHQKYVFASIESPDYYPVCSHRFDNFFNWTWTYKLDSEAQWGYMVIRDIQGNVIGPKRDMHWLQLKEMDPVSNELKDQLKTKKKAAAWFVSNCYSRSGREHFVLDLQTELKKYNLEVDIYGTCGPFKCPRGKYEDKCYRLIETDYYFYLSFENSFAEDYVTEKLLNALNHNAIPVVYGAANYTRGICLLEAKYEVKQLDW